MLCDMAFTFRRCTQVDLNEEEVIYFVAIHYELGIRISNDNKLLLLFFVPIAATPTNPTPGSSFLVFTGYFSASNILLSLTHYQVCSPISLLLAMSAASAGRALSPLCASRPPTLSWHASYTTLSCQNASHWASCPCSRSFLKSSTTTHVAAKPQPGPSPTPLKQRLLSPQ